MDISLKNERIKWALVFLIGLLASFLFSEWDKNSSTPHPLTHSKGPQPEDSLLQHEKILQMIFPSRTKQPQELFSF